MNKKTIVLVTLVLTLVFSFGCSSINDFDTSQIDEKAEQFVIDMLDEEYEDVYENVHTTYLETLQDDLPILQQINSNIEGEFSSFERVDYYNGYSNDYANDVKTQVYEATYLVTTTTDNEYYFTFTWIEDNEGEGFCGVNADTEFSSQPTLDDTSMLNTIMYIFSIAMLLFAFISLIVCAKSKIKKKALFILLMFLFSGFTISTLNGFHFRINFLSYMSEYLTNSNGTLFSMSFPLGALIFWSTYITMKKKQAKIDRLKVALSETNTFNNKTNNETSATNTDDLSDDELSKLRNKELKETANKDSEDIDKN